MCFFETNRQSGCRQDLKKNNNNNTDTDSTEKHWAW